MVTINACYIQLEIYLAIESLMCQQRRQLNQHFETNVAKLDATFNVSNNLFWTLHESN